MTTEFLNTQGWSVQDWLSAYRQGETPQNLLTGLLNQLRNSEQADGAMRYGSSWISLADANNLQQQLDELQQRLQQNQGDLSALPLYGVPCAIKDNINVLGFNTTAACPEYSFAPQHDAFAVRLLRRAGAIIIGKTNLDQFATGLVGTRSPYGAVKNPFNADYISGGSSSGSAVALARGQVAFALGTDTAGSGRVPAGFNHIVGLKATPGAISCRGVVPACRSLDCVSVFALNNADAGYIYQLLAVYDEQDEYSRVRPPMAEKPIRTLGIPAVSEWFGDEQQQQAYDKACAQARTAGYRLTAIDFTPFFQLAELLYQGPWVAERYAAVGEFLLQSLPGINDTVKKIITAGCDGNAVDAFKAEYQRQQLVRKIEQQFSQVDALLVPTTPRFPTLKQVEDAPVEVNSQLGMYTNFVNLANLSAIALPAQRRTDELPFGITVIAPAWHELALSQFAAHWQAQLQLPQAPLVNGQQQQDSVVVAVVGAHLTGMPLNHQLTSRDAVLLEQTHTAKKYQLYALANTVPPKPGLVRLNEQQLISGERPYQLIVELWRMSYAAFGSFVEEIPQPLGIGTLELEDGRLVKGFICEPEAVASATHISEFGGWRAYIQQLNSQKALNPSAISAS